MSYANMDHAAWVESNNAAGRQNHPKPKMKDGRAVGYHAAPERLTQFQARVMNILGMTLGGIYNAGISWETLDWNYGAGGLSIVTSAMRMSTFDFDHLTRFVFLCHAARIRGSIDRAGPGNWRLSFWQRTAAGGMSRRHPSLAQAVEAFEAYLPADSNVRWEPPMDEILWDDRARDIFTVYNKAPFDPNKPGNPALLAKVCEALIRGPEYKEIQKLFEPEEVSA